MDRKTIVLSVKGLTDNEIQEEFTSFFQSLVEKYGSEFGCTLSKMQQNTQAEKEILKLSEINFEGV